MDIIQNYRILKEIQTIFVLTSKAPSSPILGYRIIQVALQYIHWIVISRPNNGGCGWSSPPHCSPPSHDIPASHIKWFINPYYVNPSIFPFNLDTAPTQHWGLCHCVWWNLAPVLDIPPWYQDCSITLFAAVEVLADNLFEKLSNLHFIIKLWKLFNF